MEKWVECELEMEEVGELGCEDAGSNTPQILQECRLWWYFQWGMCNISSA